MNRSLIPFVVGAVLFASAHAAEPLAKLEQLRQERQFLEFELSEVVPDPLKSDPEISKLLNEVVKVSLAYDKAIDAHPNLKAINTKYKAAYARVSGAISSKDEAAIAHAKEELSVVSNLRNQAAAKEPGLKKLVKAVEDTAKAYKDRKREVLLENPATKDKFEKLQQVNDEIQLELKKQP